jgi:hypothetical protein
VGHASDTTITRVSAGNLAVEGNTIYRAGGTDVAIADGGTGASTAAAAATNFGLGTGDSPQFAAVNVGHASDTTITRVSAGNIAVEGNALYRAGGIDVAIADGGTGQSTAAASLHALINGSGSQSVFTDLNDEIAISTGSTGVRMTVQDFHEDSILQAGTITVAPEDTQGYLDNGTTWGKARADLADSFERKIKSADQTYTLDTSLNNDTHLQVTLVAGATYIIEGVMYVQSDAAPDFKFDFGGGTASFTDFRGLWRDTGGVGTEFTSAATAQVFTSSSWPTRPLEFKIGLTVNAGGTLILRHAQNTSAASATGLLRGSYMRIERVS